MSKSILVIDTPNSCNECELKLTCKVYKPFPYREFTVLPQCPLQDTTELLEALEELKRFTNNGVQVNTAFNKLRQALDWSE